MKYKIIVVLLFISCLAHAGNPPSRESKHLRKSHPEVWVTLTEWSKFVHDGEPAWESHREEQAIMLVKMWNRYSNKNRYEFFEAILFATYSTALLETEVFLEDMWDNEVQEEVTLSIDTVGVLPVDWELAYRRYKSLIQRKHTNGK